ncbi:CatB-related O-acetyltransferase [Flintibacter muris]|uniref:CatB-related O-acetyltransferase n=1 Tax=Flintibacter muris TaxID=2941327 RepID=UPI00203BE5B1|nr:CatB-related O-acetyltransferase [Flintibacter muris]
MKNWMEAQIQDALRTDFEQGARNFVIFPHGITGEVTKRILNDTFHVSELFTVDNTLCRYNPKIKDISYLKSYLSEHSCDNIHLIVATQNVEIQKYIIEQNLPVKLIIPFPVNRPRGSYGPLVENQSFIKSIGAFCCFAPGTAVVENHPLDCVTQHTFIYTSGIPPEIQNLKRSIFDFNTGVTIGNDVWLGWNVILTNGVKIGNGVRAAAGAVITKDVPDYAVVAGVPAKIIKYRFTPDQIRKLNEIAWWEWSDEKIRDCYDDFLDIDIFLQKHYSAAN